MTFLYLASPYSHPDPAIREDRYHRVAKAYSWLFSLRHIVYCPIVQTHWIAEQYNLDKDADHWWHSNLAFLRMSTHLYILTIPGWAESAGVQQEEELAKAIDLPITYLVPIQSSFYTTETAPLPE